MVAGSVKYFGVEAEVKVELELGLQFFRGRGAVGAGCSVSAVR